MVLDLQGILLKYGPLSANVAFLTGTVLGCSKHTQSILIYNVKLVRATLIPRLASALSNPFAGNHKRHVILVGGLTDGLFAVPYCKPLAYKLDDYSWGLVQPLLSSSHQGWGLASLDQDAAELNQLARHLKSHYGSQVR